MYSTVPYSTDIICIKYLTTCATSVCSRASKIHYCKLFCFLFFFFSWQNNSKIHDALPENHSRHMRPHPLARALSLTSSHMTVVCTTDVRPVQMAIDVAISFASRTTQHKYNSQITYLSTTYFSHLVPSTSLIPLFLLLCLTLSS